MTRQQLSTTDSFFEGLRRMSRFVLRLIGSMLCAGLILSAAPGTAQDGDEDCANGVVVPEPEDHPDLVADCMTLLALRDRVADDAELPWSTDTPLEEWEGVEVEDSVLRALDLGDKGLRGEVPPEVGDLVRLEELWLGGNKLTGPVPVELLSRLTNLEVLSLSRNELSGTIPPDLGKMTSLKGLGIGDNELTGEIPPGLGELTELRTLDLDNNKLTGGIPPELGNLENLEELLLHTNGLTGPIPPELGQLSSLEVLWLNDNDLSGPVPVELSQLENLTYLGVHKNALTGTIPPELGQLENLEALDLDTNELTGPIPALFGELSNLEALGLSRNQLSGPIPPELGQLRKMEILHLDENMLSGPIPPELGQLDRLRDLRLNDNQLTGMIPAELAQLEDLEDLRLGNNQLTGCVPQELAEWAGEMEVCGTSVEYLAGAGRPLSSGLDLNYPNPFNSSTLIPYRVAEGGPVRLEIYNLLGQPVNTLVDEVQTAGRYQASWDARDRQGRQVVSGVYLLRLHYPGGMEARQLLYLK